MVRTHWWSLLQSTLIYIIFYTKTYCQQISKSYGVTGTPLLFFYAYTLYDTFMPPFYPFLLSILVAELSIPLFQLNANTIFLLFYSSFPYFYSPILRSLMTMGFQPCIVPNFPSESGLPHVRVGCTERARSAFGPNYSNFPSLLFMI